MTAEQRAELDSYLSRYPIAPLTAEIAEGIEQLVNRWLKEAPRVAIET